MLRWTWLILLLMVLVGCGGGSDSGNTSANVAKITRATESSFSESARVLAARDAATNGATWLDAVAARQYDTDLAQIRATYPTFTDITAFPTYDLRTIVVSVATNTSWIRNWETGKVTTGEAALDTLLAEFAPESIQPLGEVTGRSAYFTLRFGQSLNMVKLAERIQAASATIIAAEPNYTAGDGNNIIRVTNTTGDGNRHYQFSRGSGDCPAGCIYRSTWTFIVSADGTIATKISEKATE